MKKKRIILIIFFILIVNIIYNFIRPKIILHGAENNSSEVSVVMDIFDKKYDGDVSLWYVRKIQDSTKDFILFNGSSIKINYPLFYDKEGSGNLIVMYYMEKNEDDLKSLHRFFVNAEVLYFWRIEIILQDDGKIQESYIKKYPWSNKEIYIIKSN